MPKHRPETGNNRVVQQNNGGKIPTNDGLLSGSIPGTVDAWYILLDRWVR